MSDFRLKAYHDVLLRGSEERPVGLYHLQIATADQLCSLHYAPTSITKVRALLRELTLHGYIQRDAIGQKHRHGIDISFSPLYYYTFDTKGMHYLDSLGISTDSMWRASKEIDKSDMHVRHTLELNDVLIAAALLNKADHRYELYRFIHERALKRTPIAVSALKLKIVPDAVVTIQLSGTNRGRTYFIEHDRGTEDQDYFRRKIRGYLAILKDELYKQVANVANIILLVTTFVSPERRDQMKEWTEKEIRTRPEYHELSNKFLFAHLPRPATPQDVWLDARWYMPFSSQVEELLGR